LDVSYVVSEFNRNKKLKKQLGVDEIFTAEQVYEFLSRHNEKYWCEFTIKPSKLPKILYFCNYENQRFSVILKIREVLWLLLLMGLIFK